MRKYVTVTVKASACKRTKNRFFRFKNDSHRIELVNQKRNENLEGDGFVVGEPMTHFGIDIYKDGLWARAWEGWIPDKEIEVRYE